MYTYGLSVNINNFQEKGEKLLVVPGDVTNDITPTDYVEYFLFRNNIEKRDPIFSQVHDLGLKIAATVDSSMVYTILYKTPCNCRMSWVLSNSFLVPFVTAFSDIQKIIDEKSEGAAHLSYKQWVTYFKNQSNDPHKLHIFLRYSEKFDRSDVVQMLSQPQIFSLIPKLLNSFCSSVHFDIIKEVCGSSIFIDSVKYGLLNKENCCFDGDLIDRLSLTEIKDIALMDEYNCNKRFVFFIRYFCGARNNARRDFHNFEEIVRSIGVTDPNYVINNFDYYFHEHERVLRKRNLAVVADVVLSAIPCADARKKFVLDVQTKTKFRWFKLPKEEMGDIASAIVAIIAEQNRKSQEEKIARYNRMIENERKAKILARIVAEFD